MQFLSRSLSQAFRKVANILLLAVAVCVVVVDDVFRAFVVPAVQALARLPVLRWIEALISRLPPYGILTLFLVPLAIIEPFKFYALYLLSMGHFASALLTFFVAKVVGLGLAERLFAIGRDKLLTIGWFAWCFAKTVAMRDRVHAWLSGIWAWQQAIRLVKAAHEAAARVAGGLSGLLSGNGRRGWLAAARRRLRQRPIL